MSTITVEPATADRFDDAEHALTGGGDGASCQCQWWTLPAADWRTTNRDQRAGLLRQELAEEPPPGLIAYVDGEPAGWIRVGPRDSQARLLRSRLIGSSPEPRDDDGVWAVTCFVVRREHRLLGLNGRLLEAAVVFARERGARVLEGYPLDPLEGRRKTSNELFPGILSTFAAAGFHEVARPRPDRAIMSLDLAG